mgnify:CR=1 FL=1
MTMPGQDYAGDFEDQFSARAGFIWKLGKATKPTQISMKETKELKIIQEYLPEQLSEEETKKICSEIITKVGAQTIKDMGKVMGELKKNYSDSIDFSKAGSMLKELLNKQWNIQKSILMKLKLD